jgi:peptidoglycan DL-endopeptidase LytE
VAAFVVAALSVLSSGLPAHADGGSDPYIVQPGDTLTSIASRFGVSVASIVERNGLESGDTIFAGDTLLLGEPASPPPPATPQATPTPIPTVTATAAATAARPIAAPTQQTAGSATHVVQQGDTSYSLARRYGITPAALQSANHLVAPDQIFVGQRLVIPPPAGASPASASSAPATTDVVALGRGYLGAPYVLGGTTPAGFDCSGFIYYVFTRAGRTMPRDMWSQYDSGPHISRDQVQPGDLVFFQNTYMEGLSHNGIYLGNGDFIHAVDEASGVALSKLSGSYWAERWYGATRPRR